MSEVIFMVIKFTLTSHLVKACRVMCHLRLSTQQKTSGMCKLKRNQKKIKKSFIIHILPESRYFHINKNTVKKMEFSHDAFFKEV